MLGIHKKRIIIKGYSPMQDPFSPIAFVELSKDHKLLYANATARDVLQLSKMLLNQKFDYKKWDMTEEKEPSIVSIHGQKYLLETLVFQQKNCLIIQPISYLQSQLAKNPVNKKDAFDVLVTQSKAMQTLVEKAKAFSKQNEPLLISGETGSGKDVLALACHRYSARGENIFLALNCAALPDDVVESELFGHARGAYPSALEDKKGFFEQAHGGSVFLDGIDEMSPNMQKKLLRFINDGTFRRVGDDNEVKVDVRIICATQENLCSLVEKGEFRHDLYYRLNVLSLAVPSLRDRKPDILPLTQFFVKAFANKQGIKAPTIDNKVIELLMGYSWPGNVRQLKNILYSALAQLKSSRLMTVDVILPSKISLGEDIAALTKKMENKTLDEMVKQFEKSILTALYADYPSSRKLSKRLGLSHTAIANKLREYGIGK